MVSSRHVESAYSQEWQVPDLQCQYHCRGEWGGRVSAYR